MFLKIGERKMTDKELAQKNRFTEEEYKKRLKSNSIKCLRI